MRDDVRSCEIYFDDLSDEAKERYLAAAGVDSADELNHEYVPIAICDFQIEEK